MTDSPAPLNLERRPLAEQVADYYAQLMIIGTIKDGDKLPGRREIARTHNVGLITGQQALEALCRRGLAHAVPQRGTFAGRRPAAPGPAPTGLAAARC